MFGANSTSVRARSWVPGTPTPTSLTSGCNLSKVLTVLMMESRTLRQPSLGVGIVVLLRNSSSFKTPHAILVAPISTLIVALIHLLRTKAFREGRSTALQRTRAKNRESAADYRAAIP